MTVPSTGSLPTSSSHAFLSKVYVGYEADMTPSLGEYTTTSSLTSSVMCKRSSSMDSPMAR
eukprot:CAMPEP_0171058608 /NCGR_PEP_ID=MMETSP0766_2-20121228/2608_1 /TAXON_ID=439317 /ORGANISM="Gambierdiscus australes, Strain CAWD 149" /LENGTH=60 /DNA_ID=CAMNT_0011513911 /DNA_START=343 /DNA_END=525 /DNA_ORIENTATION=-